MTHPWIREEDFADITFVRVRRQVKLLLLPYADKELAAAMREAIEIFDDLIADKTARL